jgi:hypothetical protein
VIFSDTWLTFKSNLSPGQHKLEWVYKKINEHGVSEDLSAEIDRIEIRGTKNINSRCQSCFSNIADEEKQECRQCQANEYLVDIPVPNVPDQSTKQCKKCNDE